MSSPPKKVFPQHLPIDYRHKDEGIPTVKVFNFGPHANLNFFPERLAHQKVFYRKMKIMKVVKKH
jgi:hypothetical protein